MSRVNAEVLGAELVWRLGSFAYQTHGLAAWPERKHLPVHGIYKTGKDETSHGQTRQFDLSVLTPGWVGTLASFLLTLKTDLTPWKDQD